MGCDGGTLPKRSELVKTKQKPVRQDPKAALDAMWKHCHVSNEPLAEPLVACDLGRLYNKEALINFLLRRADAPDEQLEVMRHIKSLKDVTELKLTLAATAAEDKGSVARWCCPVTGVEMNGTYRFFVMRPCGCVVSERALKEVPSPTCHKCATEVRETVVINGTPEEVAALLERHHARKAAAKAEKKSKKEAGGAASAASAASAAADAGSEAAATGSRKRAAEPSGAEPAAKMPRREEKKMTINTVIPVAADNEWAFSGKDVQHNPNASSVLKSLFTSAVADKPRKTTFTART